MSAPYEPLYQDPYKTSEMYPMEERVRVWEEEETE